MHKTDVFVSMSCSKSGLPSVAADYKMAGKEKWNTNPWVQYLLTSFKSVYQIKSYRTVRNGFAAK